MFHVCHAVVSVHCSLHVTWWESARPLALVDVMFSCVFVTFPCGVLGQVSYSIVSIPDINFLPYLDYASLSIEVYGISIGKWFTLSPIENDHVFL